VSQLDKYPRHTFVKGDICDADLVDSLMPGHDVVVHFAAETHVDRSIDGPEPFVRSNVAGTGVLLEAARKHGVDRFIHVSTDEVYGSITSGFADESAPLNPSSPYSASKAGADLLALAYHATHGIDVLVTRCTNNYGPYQFPEKVIPLFVTNLLEGKRVPLYGTGLNERDWLHVEDHCRAIGVLIDRGIAGTVYNIGANAQLSNRELTDRILDHLGLDDSWIDHVDDRPGHDFRYAVDSNRIRDLGWEPMHDFAERLSETIDWYRQNHSWWQTVKRASS
ncbi:MAG: dTDP-glucose 4,6-dehydratase, partial [Acidimicrobiia bacterium]